MASLHEAPPMTAFAPRAAQLANGLHWLRGELELSLVRTRAALEAHLESEGADGAAHLDAAAHELNQVRGTLAVVQCFGAEQFAREMLALLAVLRGAEGTQDEAFSALSGATLQLSDYIDLLAHGEQDRALLLQPALNELRIARQQPLVTEAELFASQAQREGLSLRLPAGSALIPPREFDLGTAQALARRELPGFQSAFLQWFRGSAPAEALNRMARIADSVARHLDDPELRTLWLSYSVLADSLRSTAPAADSLDLKRLLGRAGSQLKLLADTGEHAAASQVGDTAWLLLFQMSRVARPIARGTELIEALDLAEHLPAPTRLDDLRRKLRSPGSGILDRVYAEIRRDFAEIKDSIDLAVRTGGRAVGHLEATPDRLRRLANTLSALGLPAPQQALLNQARVLQDGGTANPLNAATWMDVATAILRVEHSLEEALFRTLGRSSGPPRAYAEIEAEVPHAQDLRNSIKALLRESLIDFAQLKTEVDHWLRDNDSAALADVPHHLHAVAAGLAVLGHEAASAQIDQLERYVDSGCLGAAHDDPAEQDRFADAVSCVEVYLEALRDGLPNPGRIVDELARYIARLDFTRVAQTAATAATNEPATPVEAETPTAAEPVAAVVDEAASAGLDPEMRDIFIDEAADVLAELERQLPSFRRDPGNRDTLGHVRRAFHTLKGSGRMVGALRIGDFGWAIENLLNRCLEGARSADDDIVGVVTRAIKLLPGLIDGFRAQAAGTDTPEDPGVASLIALAGQLASGKPAPEVDMRAVFCDDARERLAAVRQWLESRDLVDGEFELDADVIRAFHTLRGSAAVVNAVAISRLAGLVENACNDLRLQGRALPAAGLPLLADVVQTLLGWVDRFAADELLPDDAADIWEPRLARLGDAAASSVSERESLAVAPTSPAWPVVDGDFAMAALDRLQAIEGRLRVWAEPEAASDIAFALFDGCTRLARDAERSNVPSLQPLVDALASHFEAWHQAAPAQPDRADVSALLEVVESLYQQLDRYRDGEHADALAQVPGVLARIAALAGPAMPVSEPLAALPQDSQPDAGLDLRLDDFDEPLPEVAPDTFTAPESLPLTVEALEAMAAEPMTDATVPPLSEVPPAAAEPVDDELVDIFLGEAQELLDDMAQRVPVWAGDAFDEASLAALRRDLHTLKGSARMAGASAIGDVAHRLESLIEQPQLLSPTQLIGAFDAGLHGLHDQVDALRAGDRPWGAPTLAAIAAALAPPQAFEPLPELVPEYGPELVPDAVGDVANADDPGAVIAPESVDEQSALPTVDLSLEPLLAPSFEVPRAADIPFASDAPLSAPIELPIEPPIELPIELSVDSSLPAASSVADIPTSDGQAPAASFDAALDEPPTIDLLATDLSMAAPSLVEALEFIEPDPVPLPASEPFDVDRAPASMAAPEAVEPLAEPAFEALAASAQTLEAPFTLEPASVEAAIAEPEAPLPEPSAFTSPDIAAIAAAPEPAFEAAARNFETSPAVAYDEEIGDIFAAEAAELLETLDAAFEGWQNGDAGESVRVFQRALHTLKGGARMAGIESMASHAHEMESRVNAMTLRGDFPDVDTFAQLRAGLEGLQRMGDQLRRGEAELLAASAAPQPVPAAILEPPSEAAAVALPVSADAGAPRPTQFAPSLYWQPDDEAEAAVARRESARVPVDLLDTMLNEAGEISIYRSRLEEHNAALKNQLAEMTQTISRVREQLRMMDIETEAQIAARGLTPGSGERPEDRYAADFDPLEMDRYSRMQELSRALAESIGDLGSLHATMDEAVGGAEALLQQQSRITTDVQQGLMGTLMVPFARQMQRLLRVVRQTAQENGKQADLSFAGAEAELDRNVLERMTAPLEHLLRNAVVHGIEPAARRQALGKPAVGAIRVILSRDGSQLLVEVSDDGGGLDFAAIRSKAIERGLMAPETELSDDALARFIFEPGFSTASRLTQDAGRGIGMDVVANQVKQLGGTLELRSQVGLGTRFLVRLPLSLAVSQALLVTIGQEIYAVPLPSIEGIGRIPRTELAGFYRDDGPLYRYGDRAYKVRYLGDYVDVPRPADGDSRSLSTILVRLGDGLGSGAERRVALVVDSLIGNREIVTKAAGPQISAITGITGATILADGRVVLILDVPALVAERDRRALLAEAVQRVETRARDVRATVLVVDDSITMRRVAERLLVRHGYRVLTAKDGLDAMALLQSEVPASVLLDIEMPRADGFEVAAFMRNSERLKAVPIIMITSRSGDKHRERARVLGVDRYLIKPYQEDQLLGEVRALIGNAEDRRHG